MMRKEKKEKYELFGSPFWDTTLGNILFVLIIIVFVISMLVLGNYISEFINSKIG